MVLRLKLPIINERLVTSIKDYQIRQLQSGFPDAGTGGVKSVYRLPHDGCVRMVWSVRQHRRSHLLRHACRTRTQGCKETLSL